MERHLPLGRMRSSKVALNVPAGSMAPVSASLLAPFLMTPRTLLTVLIMAPSNLATSRWELNIPWNHTGRHSSVWATSRWELNIPWNHTGRHSSVWATSRWELNMPWNHEGRHSSVWATSRWELNIPWNHEGRCPSKSAIISQELNTPWNHTERHPLESVRSWTHPEIIQRDTLQNQSGVEHTLKS